jgi:glutamate synthase (NADPH/NADH) small chain
MHLEKHMYEIVEKRTLAEAVYLTRIRAPKIAQRRKAGQFIILRIDEQGERVPLTIADSDSGNGTITVIFQAVGETTNKLATLGVGDFIADVVGPLGKPTHIENFGNVICIGGGLGIGLVMPIARAMKQAGNCVISIISARRKDLLIMEDEMRATSDRLEVATDDGSYGFHGFPTQLLQKMIDAGDKIDVVVAVGPVPLMAAVAKVTRPHNIQTIVSLNPIMVDGTGMCGGCRVSVGGETKFVCVDGPEFDAHKVDFDLLRKRLEMYPKGNPKGDLAPAERQAAAFAHPGGACHKAAEAQRTEEAKARVPRQKMPEQAPEARTRNFDEVPFGYTPEAAQAEASRCLQCKKPKCVEGCPVEVDIPGFIKRVKEGDFLGAARKVKEQNSLPAVCGRVCPQEDQCEKLCVLGKKFEPVAIGNLERFVADYERANGKPAAAPFVAPQTGHRVAIVGSGPAGLTAAGDLAKMGHDVTVFEALHKAGGVLVYGIPEFRLPKAIVQAEVDYLASLGAKIELNAVVGKVFTVDELLKDGFEAVFVGTGAGLPMFLGIPGENYLGVMSANEYLTRSNLMKAYRSDYGTPIPRKRRVAVVGAGNVAMDAARTALRLGSEEVYIVYRRSRDEAPARRDEIHHAEQEGVRFCFLQSPVEIIADEKGWVKAMKCIKMELGAPDDSGRRRPVPIPGSEFLMDVELVIVAIGNGPHPLVGQTTPDMQRDRHGLIVTVDSAGKTSKQAVWAGGDIVTGAATVILAMGAGKQAARAIDKHLREKASQPAPSGVV